MARSNVRSAAAPTVALGCSSPSRSCWRRSRSPGRRRCHARTCRLPSTPSAPCDWRTIWRSELPGSLARDGGRSRGGQVVRRPATAVRIRRPAGGFEATVAGRGRLHFVNLVAVVPGRSTSAIVVVAHRDNSGVGTGANDNASGTAALIELARSYANPAAASTAPSTSRRVRPAHTIVFLSTDGGALGGVGAAHFAEHSPLARDVVAVVDLDAIAGPGRARLEFAGRQAADAQHRLARDRRCAHARAGARRRAAAERARASCSISPSRSASTSRRRSSAQGIPAVTLTSSGDRPPSAVGDTPEQLSAAARLGQIGRASQQLLGSLDEGLELAQGTSDVRLLRRAHRPRLGDRDRPRRRAAAVSHRGGRPLRADSAPAA